jgi:putative chitinase
MTTLPVLLVLLALPLPLQAPPSAAAELTLAQLRAVMPHLAEAKASQFLPLLDAAMREADITTPARRAAFLAQLAHESGELRYMEEIASGAAYEGRKDLGNTQPGDGVRYKGRGPIQLTGRNNYRAAGKALGLDLEGDPTLAAEPAVGCRVAAWYWRTRGLNALADRGAYFAITRKINGGYRGLEARLRYHDAARSALGLGPNHDPGPPPPAAAAPKRQP